MIRSLHAFARVSLQPPWVRSAVAVNLMANALQPTEIAVRLHGDCAANYKVFEQGETFLLVGDSTANVIVITFYSPSCLGLETANGPFRVRVKLPPALLSTTHGGGFSLSFNY